MSRHRFMYLGVNAKEVMAGTTLYGRRAHSFQHVMPNFYSTDISRRRCGDTKFSVLKTHRLRFVGMEGKACPSRSRMDGYNSQTMSLCNYSFYHQEERLYVRNIFFTFVLLLSFAHLDVCNLFHQDTSTHFDYKKKFYCLCLSFYNILYLSFRILGNRS